MTEKFVSTTNENNFDVDLLNAKDWLEDVHKIDKETIESVSVSLCRVEWDFQIECRSWGVKEFSCYAVEVGLDILVEFIDGEDAKELEYPVDLTDFEIDTETSDIFRGSFQVDSVMIDLGMKDVTVQINQEY